MSNSDKETEDERSKASTSVSLPFKFLRNFKIRSKLSVGFGALLICLAATAALCIYGLLELRRGFTEAIDHGYRLMSLSTTAHNQLLQAREYENDFLLHWRDADFETAERTYVDAFNAVFEEGKTTVNDIGTILAKFSEETQEELRPQLDKAAEEAFIYFEGFTDLVELNKEHGFIDTGLIGEFRSQAHALEAMIKEDPALEPLMISLLQLRRHEKDYLLRGEEQYVELVKQSAANLEKAGRDAEHSEELITAMAIGIGVYLDRFSKLVEIDVRIAAKTEELGNAARAVGETTSAFADRGRDEGTKQVVSTIKSSRDLIRMVLVIIVGVFIGGLIIAVRLASHITTPIGLLSDTAKEVEKGRLDVESPVITGGEIGQLATTFNKMIGNIRGKTEIIEQKNRENEELLLNILPGPIATRLKSGEQVIADSFECVTVLFADIVGFTQMSGKLDATDVVSVLNDIFTDFDRVAKENGVEKIKTIGDCYMAVTGLPDPQPDHAERMMRMAKGMLDSIHKIADARGVSLNVRVGLNSGPVVAGVIGTSKFIYDLWGDTVNIASRMESHGVPAKVHISENLFHILENNPEFEFESRGEIEVKGKGPMKTWLLKA
ncbi:MAG: class 3 adenylate cyclase [Verrucomicrobiales bacterium]|jgi:class 3 adenylate cyclase